jgi:Zn-dependent protease
MRVLGFPVHIRPGFIVFLGLVIVVNGGELGLWIAGSAAVLTLVHELGHAVAARATGARAEIALDFLAGYASFVPTRPLRRWERAGISIAGPAVQIGVGVAVLAAMGVDPLHAPSYARSEAALAIWWTGPVMGALNLFPVLPLDGGNIVLAGLDRLIPGRSRSVMLWFSIVVTAATALVLFATPDTGGLAVFAVLPLVLQVQMLAGARGDGRSRAARAAAEAEAEAWQSGRVEQMPPGMIPSPWFRAVQQLRHGHPDVARQVMLADFAETGPIDWWPPEHASPSELAAVADLLPRPLPLGRSHSEHVLANVLLRIGQPDEAARYAAQSFGRHRSTSMAATVARSAAALGDTETALAWLRAAHEADTDPGGLVATLDGAPEFVALRNDPRFGQLRAMLAE